MRTLRVAVDYRRAGLARCIQFQRVPAGTGDAEVQMQSVGRNPACDFFGPLDRETVRTHEKLIEHERFDLRVAFEAIRVEMHERAPAAIEGENVERGTRYRGLDAETACEPLDESGFADAEIAVQGERLVGRQRVGEFFGQALRFGDGSRFDALPQFIEDVHSRDRRGDRWNRPGVARCGQNGRARATAHRNDDAKRAPAQCDRCERAR